jgi:hypothetical protein
MTNSFDFAYMTERVKLPTIEEELEMEKTVRDILEIEDIDELKRWAESFARQNYEQSNFIVHCLDKIHYLHAKLACAENRVVQPQKSWWQKLFF